LSTSCFPAAFGCRRGFGGSTGELSPSIERTCIFCSGQRPRPSLENREKSGKPGEHQWIEEIGRLEKLARTKESRRWSHQQCAGSRRCAANGPLVGDRLYRLCQAPWRFPTEINLVPLGPRASLCIRHVFCRNPEVLIWGRRENRWRRLSDLLAGKRGELRSNAIVPALENLHLRCY
jgi:hypothetical protein